MNICTTVFIICSIFQIAHGTAERTLSLHEYNEVNLVERSAKPTNLSMRTCAKKTVACIECTGCTPGCTLCAACTLVSCATTPTCLASFCIMGLPTAGACAIKAALADSATKVCWWTCLPGLSSLLCCWPPAFIKDGVPPALKIDQFLVKWSDDSDCGETQEAEPLLDTTPLSSQLHREEQ